MSEMQRPGGLLYALGDLKPQIDPTAWIAPTAVLIGDVRVGPGKRIGRQQLWAGTPARFVRNMSNEERASWGEIGPRYVELANRYRESFRPID